MDATALLNGLVYALDVALLGFLACGAYLVLGGGDFRHDLPEDVTRPRSDLAHTLQPRPATAPRPAAPPVGSAFFCAGISSKVQRRGRGS